MPTIWDCRTPKPWAYDNFGCPGTTYEFGYSTDRELIKQVSAGTAEEMMRLRLAAEQ